MNKREIKATYTKIESHSIELRKELEYYFSLFNNDTFVMVDDDVASQPDFDIYEYRVLSIHYCGIIIIPTKVNIIHEKNKYYTSYHLTVNGIVNDRFVRDIIIYPDNLTEMCEIASFIDYCINKNQ